MQRRYLYAVTNCRERLKLGPMGVGSPPLDVEVEPVGDVGVVSSCIPDPEFTPTVDDVRAHQAVLDELLQDHTVLPFSFSTLAEGWEAVEAFVMTARPELLKQLSRLRGRIEVGLKVFWKKGAVRAELERAGVLQPDRRKDDSESRYSEAIRVGQAAEALVMQWREGLIPLVASVLRPLCEEMQESAPIGATMLWNASFLVLRTKEVALRAAVFDLDARLGDRLDFKYTSPLPPYNFVHLHYDGNELR